jgi:5'(3')-deoxyribonucleotidase
MVNHVIGLTETQEAHLWDQIVCSATFWESMPALPGAGAALQRVSRLESRQELDVWFVTSRPDVGTTLSQTERWLRQFGFASPRVIITDDKGEVAKVVRFDYFIDDRDKNCLDIKKASPGTTVMMPEKAYNRALWFSRDLVLVSDFTEAVRLIEEGL